ncbi:MAG: glycosyltransferase, partial [Proteobacteria bacterium]|nr:glycosyltransferase [Pseudomonadota bacterium]
GRLKMRSNLTVVILTLNEEKNIELCLSSAKAIAEEIVVIDSFSTDGTVSIAEKAGARIL